MAKSCSVAGCENKYRAIGFCSSHWKTYKKFGSAVPVCWCGDIAQTRVSNTDREPLCETHKFIKRFWSYVQVGKKSECWEWQGSKTQAGYGVVYKNGKLQYAHRASIELDGRQIPESFYACHKCDNPPCVNPNHLFVGTPMDNVRDMISKNRNKNGENSPSAKLSNKQVLEIKALANSGVWQSDLARQFAVHPTHVSNIVNNLVRRKS